MFRWLTQMFLTRRAMTMVSRAIPNPILRAVGVAAAGAAVTSMLNGRRRRRLAR